MRYFFHIGYHGTQYSGWQKHPESNSIQQKLETALNKLLKVPIAINGCGRTDAHVHASQYFFHVDIENEWDFDLFFRLNKILPQDIAIFEIIPMQGQPHARFDAIERTYDYFIHTYKDPFLSNYSAFYPYPDLNLDKMKAAVALLPKYNDFRGLCKCPDRVEHTICYVSSASIKMDSDTNRLWFQITANRFLSKMVRIIVGRLLEIGNSQLTVDEFEGYLISKQTPSIIIPAYPQGLYLSKVTYPYLDIEPYTLFAGLLQNLNQTTWQ